MSKTTLSLFLAWLGIPLMLWAQHDFTYISDRKFIAPNDLIGYDFRPQAMEIQGEVERELKPGEYSFGISSSNLYVDGEGIKGVYSVNNINPTEYGYKLTLMNARDPRIQGHLKLMLNKHANVEAMVFKRSNKDPEMIFYQAFMKDKLYKKEKKFFTDRNEFFLTENDTIWGQKIFPFLRIHLDQGGVQQRLVMSDSTSIEFIEKITIIEKKKKKRRKKKKKKEEEVEDVETRELADENITEADPGAYPPVEVSEDMETALDSTAVQQEKVKVKIVKEYFAKVRSIITYEDGTNQDETFEIPLKGKLGLYEIQTGGDPSVAPFELELEPAKRKGDPVVLYLNKDYSVRGLLIRDKIYLLRGM